MGTPRADPHATSPLVERSLKSVSAGQRALDGPPAASVQRGEHLVGRSPSGPVSTGTTPARNSEDLPLPDGPKAATKRCRPMRSTASRIGRVRPKNHCASLTWNVANPRHEDWPSSAGVTPSARATSSAVLATFSRPLFGNGVRVLRCAVRLSGRAAFCGSGGRIRPGQGRSEGTRWGSGSWSAECADGRPKA